MNTNRFVMIFVGVVLLAGGFTWFMRANTNLIPRELLFGNRDRTDVQISPNGKKLSYIAPHNGVMNIWVKTIGKQDDVPVTHDTSRGIQYHFWCYDNASLLYYKDNDGDENWQLYRVDMQTGDHVCLTPFPQARSVLLKSRKEYPTTILIESNKDDCQVFDVYCLDVRSGQMTLAEKNPGNVEMWFADDALQVRGALKTLDDGSKQLVVRESVDAPWQELLVWNFEDSFTSYPLNFSAQGKGMYLKDSSESNATSLVHIDFATKKKTVLAQDPIYDVSYFFCHPDTKQPIAAAFLKERYVWTVLDSNYQADFEALAQLDDGDLYIVDYDNSLNRWIVSYGHDNAPHSYYLYDRTTRTGEFLFVDNAALAQYTLATMEPITISARDGLTMHGYLTRATYTSSSLKPALVLLVHGGPLYRDYWGYDAEAQWFANRGMHCLQINYRGSTGYGKAFIHASIRERGGKMHDDLIDAVRWAIAQGLVDAKRVAIFGASFGGYAALSGAAFTPDVFACAVDAFGVSNLLTSLRSLPSYWKTSYLPYYKKYVGDPDVDEEFLKQRSPLFSVDNIKIPVLIAHGANDVRVKQAESEQIVAALKAKNIPHEYLLFNDEGHGFVRPENRLKFYAAAEKFLADCFGTRYQAS